MVLLLVVCGLVCFGVAGGAAQYLADGGPEVVAAVLVAVLMALVGVVFFYVAWWVFRRR